MARRVSMPAADDLFRPTEEDATPTAAPAKAVRAVPDVEPDEPKRASGRIRHDEKMTVYVTAEELLEIEQSRLTLRAKHGLAVDRGRLVREAVHLVLAELEEHGDDSMLVRRLREG
jgi:hypothetical protein